MWEFISLQDCTRIEGEPVNLFAMLHNTINKITLVGPITNLLCFFNGSQVTPIIS